MPATINPNSTLESSSQPPTQRSNKRASLSLMPSKLLRRISLPIGSRSTQHLAPGSENAIRRLIHADLLEDSHIGQFGGERMLDRCAEITNEPDDMADHDEMDGEYEQGKCAQGKSDKLTRSISENAIPTPILRTVHGPSPLNSRPSTQVPAAHSAPATPLNKTCQNVWLCSPPSRQSPIQRHINERPSQCALDEQASNTPSDIMHNPVSASATSIGANDPSPPTRRPVTTRAMSTGRLASEFDENGGIICLSSHSERVLHKGHLPGGAIASGEQGRKCLPISAWVYANREPLSRTTSEIPAGMTERDHRRKVGDHIGVENPVKEVADSNRRMMALMEKVKADESRQDAGLGKHRVAKKGKRGSLYLGGDGAKRSRASLRGILGL